MFKTKLMTADEIFDKAMRTMAPLPCQEDCARELAAIFSFHLTKNKLMDAGFSPDELPQQSVIMVAPTGAGKTYLLKHLANTTDSNLIVLDGSSLSRDGWKGASFSQQLVAAQKAAESDGAFARSILFIDEVDKMRLHNREADYGNPMDNLLQLFNAGKIAVGGDGKTVEGLDVSRFTIVLGGAFDGLEDIIYDRIAPKAAIGFDTAPAGNNIDRRAVLQYATPEDLRKYGLKKELIARIGSIISINPLGVEDYRCLLTADTGSIQTKYRNFFSFSYGVCFDISDAAVCKIAEQCSVSTTGARAVMPIVNDVMRNAIAMVSRDTTINKIVLSANDNGCFLQYEHGERTVSCVEHTTETKTPYFLPANTISAITDKLCTLYCSAGFDLAFKEEFEVFVRLTLTYLSHHARGQDFKYESLQKMAQAVAKQNKIQLSPFDIMITDVFNLPTYQKDIELYYDQFKALWGQGTERRITRALTTIRQELLRDNPHSFIAFKLLDG